MKVFSEHGYADTKIKQIADEADIGKGTVYIYFDNKSEILYEVFLHFENMLHDILDRSVRDSDEPVENARRLLDELTGMLRSNREMFSVLFDFWSQGHNGREDFQIPFKPFYNRLRKKFERILEDIVKPELLESHSLEEIAYVLIGFFEGQMVQWLMNPSSPPLEDVPPIVLKILSGGLSDKLNVEFLNE